MEKFENWKRKLNWLENPELEEQHKGRHLTSSQTTEESDLGPLLLDFHIATEDI